MVVKAAAVVPLERLFGGVSRHRGGTRVRDRCSSLHQSAIAVLLDLAGALATHWMIANHE
jgi:hypothetical protein